MQAFNRFRNWLGWLILSPYERKNLTAFRNLSLQFVALFEQNEITALLLSKLTEKSAQALTRIILEQQAREGKGVEVEEEKEQIH